MSFIVEIDNQELQEKIELSKGSRSSVKEKNKGRSKSESKIYNSESENLSLSDLDLIANKRKLAKKNDTFSDNIKTKDSKSDASSVRVKHKRNSTKDSSVVHKKESQWNGNRFINENENPQIRREKSEYLYKFNKLNAGNKFSSCHFDMNSPLFEIRNEYDRIKNGIENERSVKFLQRMMLLMIQGVEMLNTKFDPLGIDLDGWGESMAYSLETQEYDEVLSELYEKYKGVGNMSPEMKLMFMIISSASMFAITKRLTKNEMNLGSLLGNLMGNNGGGNGRAGPGNGPGFSPREDNYENDQSSTNDDPVPSKLDGPDDDISINDILSKMNKTRNGPKINNPLPKIEESVNFEDIRDIDVDEKTEDVLKNIIVPTPKRRGRPPRQRVNKSSLQLH